MCEEADSPHLEGAILRFSRFKSRVLQNTVCMLWMGRSDGMLGLMSRLKRCGNVGRRWS